MAICL
ncbi:hypothetical protein PENSOL_c120G07828 [Penicillium solitum]